MSDEKSVPTGVKVIAVLYYIGAVLCAIMGLLFLVGAGMMSSIANQIPLLGVLGSALFIVGGIILIGVGVLNFFVGKGLWNARSWARIVAIIFMTLGILMAILSMIQGNIANNIFGLVIELAIGGYLLFSNSVKEAFA